MLAGKTGGAGFWNHLVGDENSASKYPVLNNVIMAYVGVTLVCYVLFLIAPFVTFISQTPLRHIQSYLGVLGGILLCVDLFTNKVVWRGPYCILLYGMCVLAVLASVRTISYGIKDNLFTICWAMLEFSLFYSCAYRWEREKFGKYVKRLYGILLVIWFAACCVSLYQYVFQIGYRYVVNPLSDDNSLARQGFLESRLFGIFNPLNHSVYVSFMLLLMGVYYMIHVKRIPEKIVLAVTNLAFFFHIVLSGSRSAQVSMFVCIFGILWLMLRNRIGYMGVRKFLIPCGTALGITAICVLCFTGVKAGLSKVPQWAASIAGTQNDAQGTAAESGEKNELDNSILEREGLEEDVSNDRFKIWGDYLGLYQEIGFLGLSPGNYMSYIRENYPDLFIVQYIRDEFPGKFMNGTIYHVHNGYLMVYVSTGIAGVLLLLVFLLLCFVRLVRYIRSQGQVTDGFVFSLAIVVAGGISAVFDKGIFFMNNPSSFMFWLALGAAMAEASQKQKEIIL